MTLTEFLLARIAEDERAAKEARDRIFPTTWREDVEKMRNPHVVDFVARQKPERVLAECEAKRQIVENHSHVIDTRGCCAEHPPEPYQFWNCNVCCEATMYDRQGGWCLTVRALAAIYADHPDYQQEWAA